MMWDKKKIQAIFLFKCQICHKARRQIATLTMHLTQELLMNILCCGGSSAKEMRDFKMRSTVASHWNLTLTSEVDIDIGSWHRRWSSYSYMKSLTKSLTSNFLRSFCIWNKLGRWKAQYVGASSADQKFLKSVILKCCLLLLYATTNHFSNRLWCVTKSGIYTTDNNKLSGWTKKNLQSICQSQNCTKKCRVHCLVVCY